MACDVLAEHSKTVRVPAINIASFYEHGGDIGQAMGWFERSVREYDPDAPYIGVLTNIPATQSHPRFIALLREMKLDFWAGEYSSS